MKAIITPFLVHYFYRLCSGFSCEVPCFLIRTGVSTYSPPRGGSHTYVLFVCIRWFASNNVCCCPAPPVFSCIHPVTAGHQIPSRRQQDKLIHIHPVHILICDPRYHPKVFAVFI